MTFPINPTDLQKVIVGEWQYQYDLANKAWKKLAPVIAGAVVPTPTSANDKQALVYDNPTQSFKYADNQNATKIQNIPVDLTGNTDGYVLTYDAASGKFIPKPKPSGGGGVTGEYTSIQQNTQLTYDSSLQTPMGSTNASTMLITGTPVSANTTTTVKVVLT